MAELIGILSSVIAIAGLGAKLSKQLYVAGDKAMNADQNLNRLASNVALFSGTLKYFSTVLQANEKLFSEEAKSVALHLLSECEDVFKVLGNLAVMAQGKDEKPSGWNRSNGVPPTTERRPRRLSMANRLRAYIEGPKVDVQIASLEYLKSTLSLLIQTLILAAATADAKNKQVDATVPQDIHIHVEQERIHVETLIIARQLSVVALEQTLAEERARDNDLNGQLSPTASEDSLDDGKHPQMLEAPPSSTCLVKHGPKHIAFLDSSASRPMDLPGEATQYSSHGQIIDQLLGRWTTLGEVEQRMDRTKQDNLTSREHTLARTDSGTPELTLSKVDSPEQVVLKAAPPTLQTDLVRSPDESRIRPSHNSSLPPPPKGPARLSVNGKLPLNRSLSTPEYEAIHMMRSLPPQQSSFILSPQPNNSGNNVLAIRSDNTSRVPTNSHLTSSPQNIYQPGASPAVSPRSSYHTPGGMSNYRRPRVSDSSEDNISGVDSSNSDDGESGLQVQWRIQDGRGRFWDLSDGRVMGPRTPLMPPESAAWLAANLQGQTLLRESWVSEQALKEATFPYQIGESLSDRDGKRVRHFVILQVLKWREVEGLVNRTVEIIDARRNPQRQSSGSSYGHGGSYSINASANAPGGRHASNMRSMDAGSRMPLTGGPSTQQYPRLHQQQPHQPQMQQPPQSPTDPNASVTRDAWASMRERPTGNTSTRRSSHHHDQSRPGTAGSTSPGMGNKSPGLSADGLVPPHEKSVHFGRNVSKSVSPSARRDRNRSENRSRRKGHAYETNSDDSDDGDHERTKMKEKKKQNKRAAKVLAGIAGLTAMMEGIEHAF